MISLALGSEHRSYKGPYATAHSPKANHPVRSPGTKNRSIVFRIGAIALAAMRPS